MVGFWCKPSSWLYDTCLLATSSHGGERERGKGEPYPQDSSQPSYLPKAPSLNTITLGVKAQHTNVEDHNLVHSTISLGSPLLPFPNYYCYCYQPHHVINSYFIFDLLGLNLCSITWSKSTSKPYHIYLQIIAWIQPFLNTVNYSHPDLASLTWIIVLASLP